MSFSIPRVATYELVANDQIAYKGNWVTVQKIEIGSFQSKKDGTIYDYKITSASNKAILCTRDYMWRLKTNHVSVV